MDAVYQRGPATTESCTECARTVMVSLGLKAAETRRISALGGAVV